MATRKSTGSSAAEPGRRRFMHAAGAAHLANARRAAHLAAGALSVVCEIPVVARPLLNPAPSVSIEKLETLQALAYRAQVAITRLQEAVSAAMSDARRAA